MLPDGFANIFRLCAPSPNLAPKYNHTHVIIKFKG